MNVKKKIKELQIEKYPMAESPNLIEYFLIMGYEELYIQEKIFKSFNQKMLLELEEEKEKNKKSNPDSRIFKEFYCRHLPTILSSIGSNFSEPINSDLLIKNVFPLPPSIFYTINDNIPTSLSTLNIVFSNIQNNIVNIGYAYIFYENRYLLNKIKFYIPKAFVIISQYPFFNTFNQICQELLENQFKNKLLEIPIEIQLYNIVNFIPAPINENLRISFFPLNELSQIEKCDIESNFINLNRQQSYIFKQLSGYRDIELDITSIFKILPVEVIIQVFIQLLIGRNIAFFSKNIEILNITIFIFQQLLYPLNFDETVICLHPKIYFCSEYYNQNIVGFPCSFDEIENYNPFKKEEEKSKFINEDEENEDLDYKLFGCDLILDLNNKDLNKRNLEYVDNNICMENYEEYKENTLKILELTKKILNSHKKREDSIFESSLNSLIKNLKEFIFKFNFKQDTIKTTNYFENKFNRKIQNLFYNFLLDISYEYLEKVSNLNHHLNTGKKELPIKLKGLKESGLNEDDYLFYSLFSKTFYCNILNNFIGGYSPNEPLIYKTPRLIFEHFLSLKQMNIKENIGKQNSYEYFEIIDKIYSKNEKEKIITFLNFYKYYQRKLILEVYKLVSNKYVDSKINKQNKKHPKYYYDYKKIELDNNLLFEYIYLIDEMKIKEKNELFLNNGDNYLIYQPINQKITYKFICDSFENYFIDSKYTDNSYLISLCLLNIFALSIYNKNLIAFLIIIYDLLQNVSISIRKYLEIILSISLRLIQQGGSQNPLIYKEYFNLYKIIFDSNKILPNDELIFLLKENENSKNELNERLNVKFDEKYRLIKEIEKKNKKLFSIGCNKKDKIIIPMMNLNCEIPCILKFKSKYYKSNKEIKIEKISSLKIIYNYTNIMLNNYFQNLDDKLINKGQYEKTLIQLLYYSGILKDELPKDIDIFLFYCLDLEFK